MRPFSVYPATFDGSTLGLWRFGERGGRLVDIVNAKAFTNTGADPLDEGYRFVRTSSDYMTAAFAGQPARTVLTLEGWVRNMTVVRGGTYQNIVGWRLDDSNCVLIRIILYDNPASSLIQAYGKILGAVFVNCTWVGAELDALVVSPVPWHFALSMDNAGSPRHRLFVNGVQKGTDAGAMSWPAGDYSLVLGKDSRGAYYYLGGVLDEVRLSSAARYAANFAPARFGEGRRAAARGPGLEIMAGVIP